MKQNQTIRASQSPEGKKQTLKVVLYLLIFISLTGYFTKFVSPEAGGSDSAGYLLNAKIILNQFEVRDQIPTPIDELNCGTLDEMLTSRIEVEGDCESFNRLASYPIGLGIMHAGAIMILGDNPFARQLSMAVSLTGIIFLVYFFVLRITKNTLLAIMGSGLFLFSKQTIFSTTANISDLPGSLWVILTTYLFYSLNLEKRKKSNTFLVLSASVGIWMTFLTREVNVILLLPLSLFFFKLELKTKSKIILMVLLLGLPFMYLRYKVNGTLLTPSYGSGIFELLDSKWIKTSTSVEIFTILSYIGIMIVSVIPSRKNAYSRLEIVLSLQILGSLLFYAFYQFTGETWWCGRFIICCIPSFLVLVLYRTHKYLEIARENLTRQGVKYRSKEITSWATILIVGSVVIYVNAADEKYKVSSYQYLLKDAPKFRTVEPTIKSMKEIIPQGSIVVTMDFSAAGRYYFNNYYKFLWKPGIETLSIEKIKSEFPVTYWIYNPSYTEPPKEIVEQLEIIRSSDPSFVIGVLE